MGIYVNKNELTKVAQAQQLAALKQIVLDTIYPINSIYMSTNSTSPAILFGGTWEQLKDRFLLGAGGSYSAGSTGGASTHTLTTDQLPSHTHTQSSCDTVGKDHTHSFKRVGTRKSMATTTSAEYQGPTTTAVNVINTSYSGSHTHTCPLNNAGSGGAHNNMPPYLVVMMWKRTG